MADYEIIDLRAELARLDYQPPTETELWRQMTITGDISPAEYQFKAGLLEAQQGYEEWQRKQQS